MSYSPTDSRIGDFVIWSALAVYAAVWVLGLVVELGGEWLLAGSTAAVYVGMHVFEITRRHHCYLSADSTAVPVSMLFFSIVIGGLWAFGNPPLPGKPLLLSWCKYGVILVGGHFAALAYSVALGSALTFLFRRRIAAERDSSVGAGKPKCGG